MLDGRVDVEIAGDRYTVRAGEALHFPSGLEHHVVNTADAVADAVVIDVPET